MVAGIDEISSIAGIISLSLTLLQGCIKGFELLCRARKCEARMVSFGLMLEFEEQSLRAWGKEVGLFMNPPKLGVAVEHSKLVIDTLNHLNDLLCDMSRLKSYGFETEQTSETMFNISSDTALARLHLNQQPDVQETLRTATAIFDSRVSPWQRIKWVAVDERRFRTLLDDISGFNQKLRQLLDDDKKASLERRHDNLLRSAVMSTTNPCDLDLLSFSGRIAPASRSVAATAKFKSRGVRLGLFGRFRTRRSSSSTSNDGKADAQAVSSASSHFVMDVKEVGDIDEMKLKRRHLRLPGAPFPHENRQVAYYEDKPVMIEWRSVDPEAWKLLNDRVGKLASLLNSIDDPSFHSLRCHGYLRYAGMYGYVFDLPLPNECTDDMNDPANLPLVQTLSEFLSTSSVRPSLNARMSCAINILETLLQLHTADWLHKELRSDNVLLLRYQPEAGTCIDELARHMYVGGYVYARADNTQEYTEPALVEATSELYRHSASLGPIRKRYRKSFDVFSAGCILLELGLWSCLPVVLQSVDQLEHKSNRDLSMGASSAVRRTNAGDSANSDVTNSHTRQNDRSSSVQSKRRLLEQIGTNTEPGVTIVKRLEADMGKTYANVVLECLTAATVMMQPDVGEEINENELVLELEQRSLNRLRQLVEVL